MSDVYTLIMHMWILTIPGFAQSVCIFQKFFAALNSINKTNTELSTHLVYIRYCKDDIKLKKYDDSN